jgi:hypothetical protein
MTILQKTLQLSGFASKKHSVLCVNLSALCGKKTASFGFYARKTLPIFAL